MGSVTHNPEPASRPNMNKPTPDTGTLAGTALETLGTVFDADLGRDAIHLATIAVTTDERLHPGQHVGLVGEGKVSARAEKTIGIVDPFLNAGAFPGQRFWLVLYPRTITSLRHVWTHPAFEMLTPSPFGSLPSPALRAAAEQWLRDFISRADCPDYDTVMRTIREDWQDRDDDDYVHGRMDSESMHFNGTDAHGEIPPEFWTHVEIVLGHPPRAKPSYFSCSC